MEQFSEGENILFSCYHSGGYCRVYISQVFDHDIFCCCLTETTSWKIRKVGEAFVGGGDLKMKLKQKLPVRGGKVTGRKEYTTMILGTEKDSLGQWSQY